MPGLNPQILKPKPIKREISGVLLLDKPSGISSNNALQIAKRIFAARKAGHTGTLDPMATGLLPICFGEATKFSSALLGADKTYEAVLRLGYISTTGDAEGEISVASQIEPRYLKFTLPQVEAVLASFTGAIKQVPPMYSALKHRGKPMYIYAREGVEIERQPRDAFIHDLHINSLEGNEMRILVKCGTGTYIRTLAEDIGKALGCGGAYLTFLCRSTLDNFDLSHTYTLDALEAMSLPQRDCCLLPTDTLMRGCPAATLDAAAVTSLLQGRTIRDYFSTDSLQEGQKIRLYDQDNRFLGLGEMTGGGEIIPKRLMSASSS
ncbi:tRNA pseudouridine synthase B [Nitrosovibrio sp. Nv4]|nr:tRNA pseudouridine synthase B [Nitrosovibrio sp. Nv4]